MKFKLWLEVSSGHGWLDITGKFHDLPPGKDHKWFADQLTNNQPEPITVMLELGWQRITYITKDLYTHNPFMKPNPKQMQALIDLALEKRMDQVIWDNENNDRVIWDKND